MVGPLGLSLFWGTAFQGRWPCLDELLALWAVLSHTAALPVAGTYPLFPDTWHPSQHPHAEDFP